MRHQRPPVPAFSWDDLERVAHKTTPTSKIPQDAITVYDWMDRYGVSRQSAAEALGRLVRRGEMSTGMKMSSGDIGPRLTRFYWRPNAGR